MKKTMLLALALAAAGPALVARAAEPGPQIKTASGTVEGVADPTGVRVFRGIPFAQPPLGELRWRAPQRPKAWKGVRPAKQFGPRCMQLPVFSDMVFRAGEMAEDCLYLNVWTPAKSAKERLPVLVYIYGGGFIAGDGSEPRYDGASMARKGIVAVTLNYRLGVFGMLAHPALTQESPHKSSGNYLFMDQQAALQWVQQNIAAFGGDPKRVTIAGESAGSMSVSALMASPTSRQLIAGAIGESGSALSATRGNMTLQAAEQIGVQFAQLVGASSLSSLRAMSAQQLLQATGQPNAPRFSPIVDGHFLPQPGADIFAAGKQARVPLLAGTNSQEASWESVLQDRPPTVANYQSALQRIFGDQAARARELYPVDAEEQVKSVATELASDLWLGYSTWKWVDVHSRTSGRPAYYYFYSRPRPPTREQAAAGNADVPTGAVHSAEIEYAMGNLDSNEVFAWTEDDHRVSEIMQSYFANFVKTGDPNGTGLPNWLPYRSQNGYHRITIDVNTRLEPDLRRKRYEFLDAFFNQQ